MEKRIETHKLKCNFTDEELLNLGERLAILQQESDQIEDEKKSSVAHFASQIKIKKEEISITSTQVANKYEHRNVACEVNYHLPVKGKKTLVREDNGESWVENMSDVDWNIWNDKLVHVECDVKFHTPSEGMKTYTHKERTELVFIEHMTARDIEQTQGKLFEESEFDSSPDVEELDEVYNADDESDTEA